MSTSFILMVISAGIVSTIIVCVWDIFIAPKGEVRTGETTSNRNELIKYIVQIFVQDIFISFLILSIHYSSAIEAYKIALIIWVTFYCVPLINKTFVLNTGNALNFWISQNLSISLFGRLLSLLSISAIYSYFI